MADKETNKKIHKDAINRDKVDPKYGYISGEWHECGSHHFKYENANEPDKFFEQTIDAAGNYTHKAFDDKDKSHTGQLNVGEVRSYISGGSSEQIDSHWDMNGELTGRMEILHDMGRAVGGDLFEATKGQEHKIVKQGRYKGQSGSSVSISQESDKSSRARHGSGDDWNYAEKNHAHYVTGTSIHYTDGEDARFTNGNYDRYVDKKYHIFSKDAYIANTDSTYNTWSKQDMTMETDAKGNFKSKSDMTISSDSKITIKVGSSSVVIESGSITIKSPQIKFEQG